MDLSVVTLAQLRAIAEVDHARSFREAAAACHITQPALSMQVRKLEEALGVRVFDRSRQPVVPTTEGERVLEQARVVLRETQRLAQVVSETQGALHGSYRLGVIPTLAPSLLPRFAAAFGSAHPHVELQIQEVETEQMLQRLLSDQLDGGLAATPLNTPGVQERTLFREPLFAYFPPGHALSSRKQVRQSDLVDEQVWLLAQGHCLGDQVLHLCKAHRTVHPPGVGSIDFRSGSLDTLMGLVDSGLGVTILPLLSTDRLTTARKKAQLRPFASPEPTREVGLLTARRQLRSSISEALAAAVVDSVPDSLRQSRRKQTVVPPR